MPTTSKKAPVNIRAVNRALWYQARKAALNERMTMSEFIEQAIREALNQRYRRREAKG